MNIINLGILAHIDAGKTSVTENLLFASGATEKCGRVDNGDTITDSMDIEKRRGITVRASTTSIIWNGVKCNIIDTPGHMDFIAEVERTFKMLDGAVLILSAKEGIQAQTKLANRPLSRRGLPVPYDRFPRFRQPSHTSTHMAAIQGRCGQHSDTKG